MNFTPPSAAHRRIIGLDVLRAGAILLVLVCHWTGHFGYWAGLAVPPAVEFLGDLGVGLFFALSGFLIGRILLGIGDSRPGLPAFASFMGRRAMRTMPLYFVMLGLLLVLFPPQHDMAAVGWRFATLTQNLLRPMPADYYFAVTWSLAIEEWFYLLFGAAFIASARWLGSKRACWLCLPAFLVLPLGARLWLGDPPPLVPFRLDLICYGVLVAVAWRWHAPMLRRPLPLLGAGIGLAGMVAAGWLPAGLEPNALAAGCALMVPACLSMKAPRRWLAVPAAWIAARSYGLYLIHLTLVFDVIEVRLWETNILPTAVCVVLAIAGPFLLADLSYRLLERPLLQRANAQRSPLQVMPDAALGRA